MGNVCFFNVTYTTQELYKNLNFIYFYKNNYFDVSGFNMRKKNNSIWKYATKIDDLGWDNDKRKYHAYCAISRQNDLNSLKYLLPLEIKDLGLFY